MPTEIVTQGKQWTKATSLRRLAGVSSFGFSGTNAHVIVEEALTIAQKMNLVERPCIFSPYRPRQRGLYKS